MHNKNYAKQRKNDERVSVEGRMNKWWYYKKIATTTLDISFQLCLFKYKVVYTAFGTPAHAFYISFVIILHSWNVLTSEEVLCFISNDMLGLEVFDKALSEAISLWAANPLRRITQATLVDAGLAD